MLDGYGPKFWHLNVDTKSHQHFSCILDVSKEKTAEVKLPTATEGQLITVAQIDMTKCPKEAHQRQWVVKQLRMLSRFLRAANDVHRSAITLYPGATEAKVLQQLAAVAEFKDNRALNRPRTVYAFPLKQVKQSASKIEFIEHPTANVIPSDQIQSLVVVQGSKKLEAWAQKNHYTVDWDQSVMRRAKK
jgi:hypothetical protein